MITTSEIAEAEKLAAEYERHASRATPGDQFHREATLVARALRAFAEAGRAEPVAWQHRCQTWDDKWTVWRSGLYEHPEGGSDQWQAVEERALYAKVAVASWVQAAAITDTPAAGPAAGP